MEPLLMILVPGLFGGVLLAILFYRFARTPSGGVTVAERLEPPSPSAINMAHIRVAGLGGLGMVAMSVVVAVFVPRIRLTMAVGLVLGCAMAAILVAVRRAKDDSEDGIEPGANALLPLEPRAGRRSNVEDSASGTRALRNVRIGRRDAPALAIRGAGGALRVHRILRSLP